MVSFYFFLLTLENSYGAFCRFYIIDLPGVFIWANITHFLIYYSAPLSVSILLTGLNYACGVWPGDDGFPFFKQQNVLETSPITPSPMCNDGWSDGRTLILSVSLENDDAPMFSVRTCAERENCISCWNSWTATADPEELWEFLLIVQGFDVRCPPNDTLWVLSAHTQSAAEDHIFIGCLWVAALPSPLANASPPPPPPQKHPENCLSPSLLRKTQWLTFNNVSSSSSSNVA